MSTRMEQVEFEVVGMFGAEAGGGSPLGVVYGAEGLAGAQMRRIADRCDADETVFVLPPTLPGATHRVRVFNRRGESPFGGHSAVGTAVALVRSGRLAPGRVVQQCGDRLLELFADARRATVSATGPLESARPDPAPLLAAVGLDATDLGAGPVLGAGFGPLFQLLPVRDPERVRAARPDFAAMARGALADVFVFHWDTAAHTATARMFAPGYALDEDPACASAGLALGVWLQTQGLLHTRRSYAYRVEQGGVAGRRGVLECTVRGGGTGALTATVTGGAPGERSGRIPLVIRPVTEGS